MFCLKCGKETAGSPVFCATCGARMVEEANVSPKSRVATSLFACRGFWGSLGHTVSTQAGSGRQR